MNFAESGVKYQNSIKINQDPYRAYVDVIIKEWTLNTNAYGNVASKMHRNSDYPGSYGIWIYSYPMQSVPITTNVESSNPSQARCTRYNIM
jgi:hypothetical protein